MTETETQLEVDRILQNVPQYKPITVDKDDDLKYDLGNLCAYDYHAVDAQLLKSDQSYLVAVSRDNAQLLFTKIFQLPSKVVPDGVLAELPKPSTVLPRAKPLPKPKPPTAWQKFAQIKGIKKKSRKPQLVWDEEHQEYRRRYGYMRANNPEDQWVVPANEKDTSGVDPFTKMKMDKKERVHKQTMKEKKNKMTAQLDKAKSQAEKGSKLKDDISRTFALVSRSTASLGRFDRRLPGETEAPKLKGTRKVAGIGSAVGTSESVKTERATHMKILDKMMGKEDQVNKGKAASQFISREQQDTRKRNRDAILKSKAAMRKRTKK